ncbi:MAG: type II secretion system F family protein [bacterium]|nr:type II secretion system F family protein [bacterium]
MRFRYTARTKAGTTTRGSIDALVRGEAEELLGKRGYRSVTMREESAFFAKLQDFIIQLQRPRMRDIVAFLRQFAVMVSAHIPIVQALRLLVSQIPSPSLRVVILDIVKDVESGRKLSDAFGMHPRSFSVFAVHMIRAGETSGHLEEVLGYLADQSERDAELASRTRGAMIYPAFIMGGLVVISFIMMTFVVPRLTAVLMETGAELPWMTRALIAVSAFMAAWWWLLLILLAIAIGSFVMMLRTPRTREWWDELKLRVPIFGPLGREIAAVRFARSFEMLLRGGVDIVDGLDVVGGVLGNAAYRRLIDATIREVKDGNSITTVFEDSPLVPRMMTQLLAAGESSGQLEQVLEKLAAHHERLVEQHVRNLVTVIEPLVMIIMGVAVGIMVAAIIMPMYNLTSQF